MRIATTLADLLTGADSQHPAVVLPADGATTSFAELAAQVDELAVQLRRAGLRPGDAVAIALPNGLEWLVTFLAVTRARLVAAPLNPACKANETRFNLEDSAARLIVVPPGASVGGDVAQALALPRWTATRDRRGRVRLDGPGAATGVLGEPAAPRRDDVALFLHTSGTTSRPKGVPLTHANLMASVGNIARHYRLGPADVGLVVMPQFHVHGLIGATLAPLAAGGTVVLPPKFSASAFWPTVQSQHVTWYSAVPTIHHILLSRADADGAPRQANLRFIRSCSAALAPATLEQLERRFGVPVLEAYAMTEAAHQMTANPLPPAVHKPGSVGPAAGVAVAIMDDAGNLLPTGEPGEVVVRGPNVTAGYRANPEANRTAFTHGWFRTGDRGRLDADGYLTLICRIKELINRGGEKISPVEVDAALLRHPAVVEAATFGAPDAKYGEEVQAAVVLRADATAEQLQAHCRALLADFKVPKVIHIVTELPRTATGKVQRRQVAALFA